MTYKSNFGATVEAISYDDAFQKLIGNYVYKEVDKDDFYDVVISTDKETKYYKIRFG